MNVADAVVATLRAVGVDTFFGLPGSTEAALLEAIRAEPGLRYVLALHESAAVAMADGYARASGRPGVVGLHTTVGTMNGMSQLYNAARDGSPVVLMAGHKDRPVLSADGFCAIPDLAGLLRPFTKSSWQSLSAGAVAADLARALHAATASPSGPTFLAVPEDLLREELAPGWSVVGLPGVERAAPARDPDPSVLAEVAERLSTAHRPVAVVGTHAAHATEPLQRLAEVLCLPVLAADLTDLGTLTFPADDPHALGVYGEDPAVLEGCDLVLALGCRVFYPFSERLGPRLPEGASLIHVHPDPAVIGRNLPTAIGIAGDPLAVLQGIVNATSPAGGLDGARRRVRQQRLTALGRARRQALDAELAAARAVQPMSVVAVAAELARVWPAGTIVVEEGVRASRHLFRHGRVPAGGAVWRSSGGALGWGVPAAVGARLAAPDRPVVAVVGDGSLHFSVQALWTACAQAVPLVVVVLDNGGYLAVKRAVESWLGVAMDPRTHPGTEISGIDHGRVATGYGAIASRVATAAELAEAVETGLRSERVHVVVARVAQVRP